MNESTDAAFKRHAIRFLIKFGSAALLGSTAFLLLSAYLFNGQINISGDWSLAICMMLSRIMGIAAFLCGTALLLLEQWAVGPLIFILSLVLPAVFVMLFETI
ncbi:MAG: hypothetical protein KDD62_09285 [Bdellovibrionales bacterium]|nr:hypothetical protein [Bdellovibrionales bacterium]